MGQSDEELVALAASGKEEALNELVARYLREVYSFAARMVGGGEEAEDIAQETFVKVWRNLKRYDERSSKFKTWLMRIARNTCVDHLRKHKHTPLSQFESSEGENILLEGLADEAALPDELANLSHNKALIERALAELSAAHREAILLRYQDDLSFAEMAEVTGESQNTLKSRHRRALHQLRELLRMYLYED